MDTERHTDQVIVGARQTTTAATDMCQLVMSLHAGGPGESVMSQRVTSSTLHAVRQVGKEL